MSRSRHTNRRPSLTGALNRWAATIVCLLIAGLCGYQAWQTDSFTRAIDSGGVTVRGTVVDRTMRACMLGDFCLRRRQANLTHVGYATIRYPDQAGRQLITHLSINNETMRKYPRGKRVPVTYPVRDPQNTSIGNVGFNRRGRLVAKVLYTLGALALIAAAFWIHSLPSHEFADGRKGNGRLPRDRKGGLDRFYDL